MDHTVTTYLLLLLAGFVAGIVNTMAGGASVFTLSILLFFGMPVNVANGTNRLGILVQNLWGSYSFHKRGLLSVKKSWRFALPSLVGALLGAVLAVDIDQDLMEIIIGLLMTGVLFLIIFNPKRKYKIGSELKEQNPWVSGLIFFAIGVYGGFVQAGIGIIILVALFRGANFTLLRGNGVKMLVILLYTIPVLGIFVYNDQVAWEPAVLLAVGQVLGTWFTDKYAVSHPKANILVRRVLIIMIGFSILKSFRKGFKYLDQGYNELIMQIQSALIDWDQIMISQDLQQWFVLAIMLFIVVALLREWMRPAAIFLFASVSMILIRVVDPLDWLASFANKQIATIILLILLTSAIRRNFNVEKVLDRVFKRARTGKAFLWRMCSYVAVLSSFLNNTPVVAFMTPYIYNWSKRLGLHPSKLLIPLSYATILGGMITMLGTSTNLVLNGFMAENGVNPLEIQDFFFLGVLVTAIGIAYLYYFGYNLLPENREAFDDFREKAPEYTVEIHVTQTANCINKSIQEAGLMSLKGAYLIEIIRNGESIPVMDPNEKLYGGDILLFIGKTEAIIGLTNSDHGLQLPEEDKDLEIVEVVVPANSTLAGHNISNEHLQRQYDAKAIAIHRNGEKIKGTIEAMKLSQGDLLLLSVGKSFLKNIDAMNDFYVLSKIDRGSSAQPKSVKVFLVIASLILLAGFLQAISLFTVLLFLLTALLALDLYTFKEIKRSIDADLVVLLASALTIGSAIIKTGAGDLVASSLMQVLMPMGILALMIGLFVITVLLTSFVTNVAAVSIMFPVAYSISAQLGIDGTPLYVILAFAASAAFLTPVGYQTNWMVYGPGGYKPKDFMRVGFPLLIIYAITCITFTTLYYDVY